MRKCFFLSCLIMAMIVLTGCAPKTEVAPDLIIHNAKVLTVDKDFRVAEAVAIRGDQILDVGSNDRILALAGEGTTRYDAGGKMVLPGLMDSHVHAVSSAMFEFDHEVPEMQTIADVLAYVKSRAAALGPDKWVNVSQVFITRLKEQRYPTRAELDDVAPANPVAFRTGPDASLNTMALKLSGIDRNFTVTDGSPCRVEKDAKGDPTGILRQCGPFIKSTDSERVPTEADKLERTKQLFADYNSVGITSIGDGDTEDEELEIFRKLKDSNELTVRIFSYIHLNSQDPIEKIEARIKKAASDPLHTYNNMLWLRGAKVFLDGGMLTGSAYMLKPWGVSKIYSITDPEYRGMRYIEPDKLAQIMRAALQNQIQLTAHSQGDAAVTTFVDTAERLANEGVDTVAGRPMITHGSFMTEEAILKMAQYGVVANMQPNWLQLDGATLMKHFGEARTAWFQPYRTLFDRNVMVGGGSDHMQKIGSFRSINQYNPFLGMWTTIVRTPRWMDKPFHPEQDLTRQEAIRFYTINNAFLLHEEDKKGSLEKGKLADLIVVDRDLLTCPIEDFSQTKVLRTYLGGKLVYEAK
ncbi:MAG: amidohydrolase [Bryobacterales bacterium]|nr:amidohydrolase [Bryobacterales bacterium]